MLKYDLYNESGVKWIGMIPNHWTKTKMKFFLKIFTGYSFKSDWFKDSGVPVVRISNIQDGFIDFDKCVYLPEEYREEYTEYLLFRNDTLICLTGSLTGKVGIFNHTLGFLNQRVGKVVITNDKKLNKEFVDYIFLLERTQKTIKEMGEGISENFPNVSHLDVVELIIPIPPLSEQNQIVQYLDSKTTPIDTLIETTKKKIELLKEQRTSLINHVVTKGLNPDVETKKSGVEWIGEIPKHWVITKMKYVTQIFGRIGYRGYTVDDIVNEGEGVITISPSNISNDLFNIDSVTYLSFDKYYQSPEIMIFPNDIILVKTGSTIGKTSIIPTNTPLMTINPQLVVLKEILLKPRYLYYQTTCKYIKESFYVEQTGSSTPTISQEKVNNFPILTPPKKEQQQIVDYLDNQTQIIDTTIQNEEKRIELLTEYRKTLISEVVTGKIKVTTHE